MRTFEVEIVRPTSRKRFIGGYRSRLTGMLYYHAEVQTMSLRVPVDRSMSMQTRSTQTHSERHFLQQTSETTSTQMTGIGVYIPDLTDKLLEPRRYVTADEFLMIRSKQVTFYDDIYSLVVFVVTSMNTYGYVSVFYLWDRSWCSGVVVRH